MISFYLVVAILLCLSVAWWMMSVRMNPALNDAEQRALAREQVNIYQLRLAELARDLADEMLDEAEYESSVIALKQQLRQDLRQQVTGEQRKKHAVFLPGAAFLLVFVGLFYVVNGGAQKVHDWADTMAQMPTLAAQVTEGKGNMTPKQMQQFALALRTTLHEKGDNAEGWRLLGRVTFALEDIEASMQAYNKAYELDPYNMSTLLHWSYVMLNLRDESYMRRAALLLAEALRQDPQNAEALWMVAGIAEVSGDMDKAVMTWRMLTQVLDQNDGRYAYVVDKLRQATGPASATASTIDQPVGSVPGSSVTIQLSLAEGFEDKLPEQGTLFVYAKAPQGRPMPAAVVKLNDFSFPLTVELGDANAMLPDYKLSGLEQMVIFARVSKDGDIGVSAGELQGQSEALVVKQTQSVNLVIDSVL